MSLNIVAVWPVAIVCVSDRRLVDSESRSILTNRSTKMTLFGCADAHGVIAYNGIGSGADGKTPSEWLLDLHAREKTFDLNLVEVLEGIRADLDRRLQALRRRLGPQLTRHTYACGYWRDGRPSVAMISNYETFDGKELAAGRERVEVENLPLNGPGLGILSTGAHPRPADLTAIGEAIKGFQPLQRIKSLCVKAVRSEAFRMQKGRGTVSASAQWAVLGAKREEVWYGHDVVGGQIANEPPNLINIGAETSLGGRFSVRLGGGGGLVKDTVVSGKDISEFGCYDPTRQAFIYSEPKCGICGSPFPASQKHCEVCIADESAERSSRKRRRTRQ